MRAWRDEDKTPWFEHWKKPMRSGVYEVEWRSKMIPGIIEHGYAFFDANKRQWGWTTTMLDQVVMHASEGARQDKRWRGLREGALLARQETLNNFGMVEGIGA